MNDEWALIKISLITCMWCKNFTLIKITFTSYRIHMHGIRVLPDRNLQQINQSCKCQHTKQIHLSKANRCGFVIGLRKRERESERERIYDWPERNEKTKKVIKTSFSNSIMGQDRADACPKLVNNSMEPAISTQCMQSRLRSRSRRRTKTTIFTNWARFMSHNWIITQPRCKQTNHNISAVSQVIRWFLLRKQSKTKILTAIITFLRRVDFRRRRKQTKKKNTEWLDEYDFNDVDQMCQLHVIVVNDVEGNYHFSSTVSSATEDFMLGRLWIS